MLAQPKNWRKDVIDRVRLAYHTAVYMRQLTIDAYRERMGEEFVDKEFLQDVSQRIESLIISLGEIWDELGWERRGEEGPQEINWQRIVDNIPTANWLSSLGDDLERINVGLGKTFKKKVVERVEEVIRILEKVSEGNVKEQIKERFEESYSPEPMTEEEILEERLWRPQEEEKKPPTEKSPASEEELKGKIKEKLQNLLGQLEKIGKIPETYRHELLHALEEALKRNSKRRLEDIREEVDALMGLSPSLIRTGEATERYSSFPPSVQQLYHEFRNYITALIERLSSLRKFALLRFLLPFWHKNLCE